VETDLLPILQIIRNRVHLDAICLFRADNWLAKLQPISASISSALGGLRDSIDITGEIAEKLASGNAADLEWVLPVAWLRFPRRFAVALRYDATPVGLLAGGRESTEAFSAEQLGFVKELSPSLAGPLASSLLHRELTELRTERDGLRQKLADRKIMERAKGIIQARAGLTEEQAYLELRRMSRQSRATMAETASRIVDQPSRMIGLRRMSA
jgi:hypothetical protein